MTDIRQRMVKRAGRNLVKLVPDGWWFSDMLNPEGEVYRCPAPGTTLRFQIHHRKSFGDRMMMYQATASFVEYLKEYGDPELGDVVITTGGFSPDVRQPVGDLNLYWWYSFGPFDEEPERFLDDYFHENITVEPDVVLCGSKRIEREARQAGYETLYFPIGVDASLFRPLELERTGLGYAGSKGHKGDDEVEMLLGPFRNRADFTWVDDLLTPGQMSLWYNNRLATLGLTREGQREWGVVNSRVFETLASGTPLVLHEHPAVDDVLGFDYPYQASSSREAVELVERIEANPEETLAEFAEYSERVREEHSYVRRLRTLVDHLE